MQQIGEGTGRYKAYACDSGASPASNPESCSAASEIVNLYDELAGWAGSIALVKGFTGVNTPLATADAKYGYSVALAPQKNLLAVGAPGENAVYIYGRDALTNNWVPRRRITPPGGPQGVGGEFGYSLALVNSDSMAGGAILAVGMPGNSWAAYGNHRFSQLEDSSYFDDLEYRVGLPDPFVTNSGAVFTYRLRNGGATIDAESIIKPFNSHEGQRFGESIAMAEREYTTTGGFSCEIGRLVVGAPGDSGAWQGKISPNQYNETNRALQTSTSLQNSGAVFLLTQRPNIPGCLQPGVESFGWSPIYAIKSSQANVPDRENVEINGQLYDFDMPQQSRLGTSVAITADGDFILAGAPGERGHVSFEVNSTDAPPEIIDSSNILSSYPTNGIQRLNFPGYTFNIPRGAAYLFDVNGNERAYLRRGSGDLNAEGFGQAVAIQRTETDRLRLLIADEKTEVAAFESLAPVSVNNSGGDNGQALLGVTNRTLGLDAEFTGSVSMAMSHDGKFAALGTASAGDTAGTREGFVMLDFDATGKPRVLEGTDDRVMKPSRRTYQAFGQAVSLSADGQQLVIGAPLDSCTAHVVTASAEDDFCGDAVNDSGAVYVY